MLGRFIGPIRPILPLTAGMFGMNQFRFAAFNSASALIWAPFYLLPGYFTGKAANLTLPDDFLAIFLIFLCILAVIGICFRYLSIRLQASGPLYEALLLRNASGFLNQKLQSHYAHFRHAHPKFEFPLASISLMLINLCIFSVWTFLSTQTNLLTQINQLCLDTAMSIRGEMGGIGLGVSKLATRITLLGDEAFLYVSFSLFVMLMIIRRHYFAAIHIAIAGLLTAAVTHTLKVFFEVDRPDTLVSTLSSFAYPSGHSSGATVLFALLASFIAQELKQTKRWQAYLILSIPIILIAFSRVLLGVHWLTDVVAGISLGLIISSLTRISYSYVNIKDAKNTPHIQQFGQLYNIGMVFIWCFAAIIYQYYFFNDAFDNMQLLN